jgi:hypothetical protein
MLQLFHWDFYEINNPVLNYILSLSLYNNNLKLNS